MTRDRDARLAIAQRIAAAENRVSQLRDRVTRLKSEGSDASQAQEMLRTQSCDLGNLYCQQNFMRQAAWAIRLAESR